MSPHSSQSQIKVRGEQDASQFDWQPAVSGVISAALCPAVKCGQTSCYASQSDVRTCSASDDTWRHVAITSCELTVNQSGVRQPRCQVWCMKNALLLVQVQSHAQLDVKLQLRSKNSLKLLKKNHLIYFNSLWGTWMSEQSIWISDIKSIFRAINEQNT